MSEKIIKKLFRNAKEIKLSEEQKSSARASVLTFIKSNPLPCRSSEAKAGLPDFLFKKIVLFPAGALAIILLLGFVVSAEADTALPGDVLYQVKLSKEQVMQALAPNDQVKTELSMQFAEERLKEAEKLTLQGKINNVDQSQIADNFQAQADNIQNNINKLNSNKNFDAASEIASDFESSLKAHGKVLKTLKNDSPQNVLDPLINKIINRTDAISETRTNSSNEAFKQTGDDILKQNKTAETKLDVAQKTVEDLKKTIDEHQAQAKENLKKVEQKIAESRAKIDAKIKDYKGSFSSSEDAIMSANELKKLIETGNSLKINVNLNNDD